MTYVLDASAALECLLRTAAGEQVAALIRDAPVVAPDLIDVEVLSALRRGVREGKLSARRADEAVQDLAAWGFRRLPGRTLVREAWTLRANLTAYDAVYVAAARLQPGTLLTADGLLARAPVLGVPVQNIRM